jgi:hypothetical protein
MADQSKDWPLQLRSTTIAEGILCALGGFDVKHFRLFEDCEFGGVGNVEAFGASGRGWGGNVSWRPVLVCADEG